MTLALVLALFCGAGEKAMKAFETGDYPAAYALASADWASKDPEAAYMLSVMHANGLGAKQDEKAAVQWLRRAAEGGYGAAAVELGQRLEDGQGVPADPKAAAAWYAKGARLLVKESAKPGFRGTRALANLGMVTALGKGVKKDEAKGLALVRRAAELGDCLAQRNLGDAYAEGRLLARDLVEAYRWYRLAGSNLGELDCRDAEDSLVEVEKAMSESQKIDGEKRAAATAASTGQKL